MNVVKLVFALILLVACQPTALAQAQRVALVIGNDAYQHTGKLDNAVRDASAVATMLADDLGFDVIKASNVKTGQFDDYLERFQAKARRAQLALVYYAGHGMEYEGQNYLVPIDAKLERSNQLKRQTVAVQSLLTGLRESGVTAKLVILDCCRDMPLTRSWTRSTGQGMAKLASESLPPATMVLYAAAPGKKALDGEGRHSPFTTALLEAFRKKGQSCFDAVLDVSDRVVKATGAAQEPWVTFDGGGRTFRSFALAGHLGDREDERRNREQPASAPGVDDAIRGSRAGEEREFAGMTFVWCPPGRFTMGSPASEEDRDPDEDQVSVILSEGFWLGKHEVTQEEWERVMKSNPSYFKGARLPVEKVRWENAQAFLRSLSVPPGLKASLPSEAQWEYACRAGTEEARYGELDDVAWYDGNSGRKTHVVGSKKANAWGLHDMLGNVHEWCGDWYDRELLGGRDPNGSRKGESRVHRGGSWFRDAGFCRAAGRQDSSPGYRNSILGFRACLRPAQKTPPLPRVQETPRAQEKPRAEDVNRGSRAGEEREFAGMQFVWCPPGRFTMGSPKGEEGRFDSEAQVEVKLRQGFWLGKYEVTQEEWDRVMGTSLRDQNAKSDYPGIVGQGGRYPMYHVNWTEAQEFCGRLSASLGWEARLPSEAQWEYACRAGTEGARYRELDDAAWYDGNSGSKTHVVGSKRANAWGLHDMLGNVHEWCGDWYDRKLSGGRDPHGSRKGEDRVDRGGSWDDRARSCRAAFRYGRPPGDRGYNLGFRVCLSPAQKTETSPRVQEKPRVEDVSRGSHAGEEREYGGMRFVWCPPGRFIMGSPKGEEGRFDHEDQVRVTLSKGFWLGKYEVTQEEWERVMGTSLREQNAKSKVPGISKSKIPGIYGEGARYPMYRVNWTEAQEFCGKVSASLGWEARLPSEAEWEYACRAGSEEAYYGELDAVAWYAGNRGGGKTHVVGGKQANAWGLHDMLGNVWEWTGDWASKLSGGRNPNGPIRGEARVNRGGSHNGKAKHCRAAHRNVNFPEYQYIDLGFRVCLSP